MLDLKYFLYTMYIVACVYVWVRSYVCALAFITRGCYGLFSSNFSLPFV